MIDLIQGHALTEMRAMPDGSVECIVTSPPYWSLRSYGTEPQVWPNGAEPCAEHQWGEVQVLEKNNRNGLGASTLNKEIAPLREHTAMAAINAGNTCLRCGAWRGELGLEPTPELYVEHLVQIFREARRVLRDDGTLWLNLGDSYAGSGGAHDKKHDANPGLSRSAERNGVMYPHSNNKGKGTGLKPKDLVGIPWMVAFALRADGWYLRSDVIWAKPNPMPESVTDRPTKAHEYIFLLSKSEHYYYDADAIREPLTQSTKDREQYPRLRNEHKEFKAGVHHSNEGMPSHFQNLDSNPTGRNKRTVWTVSTQSYSGAHFATFPPKLIEPCILAGTSAKGVCPECGAPWERVTESKSNTDPHERVVAQQRARVQGIAIHRAGSGLHAHPPSVDTLGWRPTCSHNAEPVPATVLDPFGGSGTTGRVAVSLGRKAILIDLKPEYLEMANERTSGVQVQLMPGM